MFYKIVEISNLAEANGSPADGIIYVKVQFGDTAQEVGTSPFLVEDFLMQIPAEIIEEGVSQGEFPAHNRIIENIEAHIPRIQAISRTGQKTDPGAVRNGQDPTGIIGRPTVQALLNAVRQA